MDHLTLGELINKLNRHPADELLYTSSGLVLDGKHCSYRGYYEDLALNHKEEGNDNDPIITCGQFSDMLQSILGAEMYGYKGGEYVIEEDTYCWLSNYRECSSLKIVGVEEIGSMVFLMTVHDWDKY